MFAEKLKKMRKEKGISQKDLAENLNMSPSTIANSETGARVPDLNRLKDIADFFNISVDYLVSNKENNESNISNNVKYIKEFEMIPILGCIRAGVPVMSKENIIDYKKVPAEEVKNGQYFYLEVKGESMSGARIHEGDLLLVKKQPDVNNGDIAVVMIEDEQTVKRVYKSNSELILEPENPKFEPIVVKKKEVYIIGKVEKVEFTV